MGLLQVAGKLEVRREGMHCVCFVVDIYVLLAYSEGLVLGLKRRGEGIHWGEEWEKRV